MPSLSWQEELRKSIRNPTELVTLGVVRPEDLPEIQQINDEFAFSITPYYAKLINWADPHDPLLRIVAPDLAEHDRSGSLDVGGEAENTQDTGIQMKYPMTALLLPVPACFSYCRFCFRKRLFDPETRGDEILKNIDNAVSFVRSHPGLNNVLLTGGDPLLIKTPMLERFLIALRECEHVKIIRFGTRALVFLPSRITTDPDLLSLLSRMSGPDRRVYFVNHFNHPREITPEVMEATDMLMKSSVVMANQTVVLRGVNDSAEVLRELLNRLAFCGIMPYYVFQCKFIEGSGHFRVPLRETCRIFGEATRGLNGLAKRARLIMAHFSGKIEILGTDDTQDHIYLKYHQARDPNLIGRILCYPLPRDAYWLDDLPGWPVDPRVMKRGEV